MFNISKETTFRELIEVVGIDEYVARMQGINLSGGATNALEFCQALLKFPTLFDLLEKFKKAKQLA